ncbi:MAG: 23S rRNA (adenine(2503)-C(2))-methyltransferase RlmN [Spirochaetaceae bacterium]|jgi:23S rRNA (adenine2503-C2)-methyltransferase|nr:23S rRNA (adenine(2503)-C(2))-methyltransferase RlmN [Spirochaetaceae bacterium]
MTHPPDGRAVLGLLPEELAAEFALSPPFRARQVFSSLWQGARSFSAMTSLPLSLRESLAARAEIYHGAITETLRAPDGTVKARIEFAGPPGGENTVIEAVVLRDRAGRRTACVSSQGGCALGCGFCKTGTLGFTRNLTAGEMCEQFLALENISGPLGSLVFMGMGEPLLNLEAVLQTIRVLNHRDGRNLSPRRITVSTAGIIGGIYALAERGLPVRLAVSLPAADESLRRALMPGTPDFSLGDLRRALLHYAEKTGRRCTLEAVLLSGVNTGRDCIRGLADFAKRTRCHVNLIPWNAVEGLPFTPPTPEECRDALAVLTEEGVNGTLRMSRGGAVAGACGQLGGQRKAPSAPSALPGPADSVTIGL